MPALCITTYGSCLGAIRGIWTRFGTEGSKSLPRRSFSEGGFKSFRPDQFLTISAKSSLPEHSVPPLFDGEIINATPQDVVARLSKRGAAILRLPPFH
jgi:hypothetical protein